MNMRHNTFHGLKVIRHYAEKERRLYGIEQFCQFIVRLVLLFKISCSCKLEYYKEDCIS